MANLQAPILIYTCRHNQMRAWLLPITPQWVCYKQMVGTCEHDAYIGSGSGGSSSGGNGGAGGGGAASAAVHLYQY